MTSLLRGCSPTVNHHGNNGFELGLQLSRARFRVSLPLIISKVPDRLLIRIVSC